MQGENGYLSVNSIAIDQNKPEFIKRLAAQRSLYSIAKNIFAAQFVLSVLMVFFVYLAILFPQLSLGLIVFGLIIGLLGVTAFPFAISKYKKKAASIQEVIDCDLLKIPWNKDLVLRPDPEDIQKYSQKLLNNDKEKKKLFDWYEGIPEDLTYSAARIICQRYNLMWDLELRAVFSLSVKIVAIFILSVLIILNAYQDVVLKSIILNIIVPSFPIIVFTVKQHMDNKGAVDEMKNLKNKLDDLWGDLLLFRYSDDDLVVRSRSVQNMIFLYRKGNPLIPDWFSMVKHKVQQNIAGNTVLQLASEYSQALKRNR